jgi:hypothetical protein
LPKFELTIQFWIVDQETPTQLIAEDSLAVCKIRVDSSYWIVDTLRKLPVVHFWIVKQVSKVNLPRTALQTRIGDSRF